MKPLHFLKIRKESFIIGDDSSNRKAEERIAARVEKLDCLSLWIVCKMER